jgi:CRISPR-associated protein Cas1
VAWLGPDGRCLGRLVPDGARGGGLRRRQYEAFRDEAGRLARARAAVSAKAAGARAVLLGLQSNDAAPAFAEGLTALTGLSGRVAACVTAAELCGVEGALAAAYFEALRPAFRADLTFAGRRRRPPPDPANALLSLGYVLLTNRLAGVLEARGLDAEWGFYHEERPGRPSLALDLVEELRHPLVDRFVLRGCNLRVFRPEHFEADVERPGGVRLTRAGWKLFLARWEEHLLRPLRDAAGEELAVGPLLARQADRLAADVRGGPAYEPFRPWGA